MRKLLLSTAVGGLLAAGGVSMALAADGGTCGNGTDENGPISQAVHEQIEAALPNSPGSPIEFHGHIRVNGVVYGVDVDDSTGLRAVVHTANCNVVVPIEHAGDNAPALPTPGDLPAPPALPTPGDLPAPPALPTPGDLPAPPALPTPDLPALPTPGDLPALPGPGDLPAPPALPNPSDLPVPALPGPGDLPVAVPHVNLPVPPLPV